MEILSSYNLIIETSVIIILSFIFNEISYKTNIPSVLLLIVLGMVIKFGIDYLGIPEMNFFPILEILGILGLIMIVLEAALELELTRDKIKPILKALIVATIGLFGSSFIAAEIIKYFIDGMTTLTSWVYAVPLSILSSAIIIPSVGGLKGKKKEFHIYESTFSDILGIMVFYFLIGQLEHSAGENSTGILAFFGNMTLTFAISFIASFLLILVFQKIKSQVKLFLLISALMLFYALGKQMHLSSLIMILVFGLLISNMQLFFRGRIAKMINFEKAKQIHIGLHIITAESAFIVRTLFFVVFGITITLSSLVNIDVAIVSVLVLISIYLFRYIYLKIFIGKDIIPQLFIAPRGLITILLFYAIPNEVVNKSFNAGILLFIIIGTSLIMTFSLIYDKHRSEKAVRKAKSSPIYFEKWKAPEIES